MARAVEALNALRLNDPDKLGDWFGRFITTYRAGGEVVAAAATRVPASRSNGTCNRARVLQRHPFSRLAWRRSGRMATLVLQRPGIRPAGEGCAAAGRGRGAGWRRVWRAFPMPAATRRWTLYSPGPLPAAGGRGRADGRSADFHVEADRLRQRAGRTCARCARPYSCRNSRFRSKRSGMRWIRCAGTSSPATSDGQPIGTGRLTPEHKIGRMAVLADWRGARRGRCDAGGVDGTKRAAGTGPQCR